MKVCDGVKNKKTITAIILAAGNSVRFGTNSNKNLQLLNGKHILMYSLDAFNINSKIDNIIVAVKHDEIDIVKEIINSKKFAKDINLVRGGSTRKESVYNCLKVIDSEFVIIHDGARPLIKQEYIDKCIAHLLKYDGVTIGVKSRDTVKISNDQNIVINSTNRDNTWLIQTPQGFKKDILLKMHEKYKNTLVTDDCQLLEMDNYKIKIIEGNYSNVKVTYSEDLEFIKHYI